MASSPGVRLAWLLMGAAVAASLAGGAWLLDDKARAPPPRAELAYLYVLDEARAGPGALARLDALPHASLVYRDAASGLALLKSASPVAPEPGLLDPRGAAGGASAGPSSSADVAVAPWAWDALALDAAPAISAAGEPPLVALLDSGVPREAAGVQRGGDYVDDDRDPQDESGHGTAVVGLLDGLARRLAPDGPPPFRLLAIRVLDGANAGDCSDVALGIVEAVERGAAVVNVSLGCGEDNAALRLATRHAAAEGVLVVAAAGNHQARTPAACPLFPARYPEALAVGAVDERLEAAIYSCHGADLVAPGEGVLAGPGAPAGTSLAAPLASGLAAALKHREPTLDAEGLRGALVAAALDVGSAGRDALHGEGLLRFPPAPAP